MPFDMKAFRFERWQSPPVLTDVPVPEPGPGQVLLRVGGSGACHSDLHVMEWPSDMLPWKLPFTLGHEVAGWVEAVGAGVTGLATGVPVAVYGPWGCGACHTCRLGEENYCERAAELGANGGGLGLDGGMAEYMLVPSARMLVPLGDLDPAEAAPLSDAALTPYHAIKRSLPLLIPGSTAVAIGVGGLGHVGVQILRALTPARIVAVDRADDKLALAREVGADAAVRAGDEAAAEIRSLTGGRGAEVVIDFVGSDDTLALAAKTARPKGHITIVGIAGGTLPVSFFSQAYEAAIATTYWGSITELMECIELARQKKIHSKVTHYPLADVEKAYRDLREGKLQGRAVVVPATR